MIDTCLDELHEEICKDLEQLGKDVAKIDAKVDKLYDKPELQTVNLNVFVCFFSMLIFFFHRS